jgi:hypothetical protein
MKVFYTYCKENGEVIGITDSEIAPEYSTTLIYNGNFVKPYFDFEENVFYERATEQEIKQSKFIYEVALWKIRAVLASMDLEQSVLDAINALPNPPRIGALYIWNYGTSIERNSQTIGFIQLTLQLTDEQVDEIFINANNIVL